MTTLTPQIEGGAELIQGVYSFPGVVPETVLASGDVLTMADFGQAGVAAGKSVKYGRGVLYQLIDNSFWQYARAERAKRGEPMVGPWTPGPAEHAIYLKLLSLTYDYNRDRTKKASYDGLAVATELVHNVWLDGEGLQPSFPVNRDRLGPMAHKVISIFFEEEQAARLAVEKQESDDEMPNRDRE